jgi:MFS family permease
LAIVPETSRSSARIAFRYPNFRYYTAARFLATLSLEMQAIGVAWQIYGLTHRPLDLGLVGLAQFAPAILLFLVAGHTADHVPRKRIIQTCYASFALCSALLLALSLHGFSAVWPIYAVVLGIGTVRAFNGPASSAFLPLLVTEEHFPNAVTWGSSIYQSANILGPVAGGLIYGIASSPLPVYCCAAIAFVIAVLLMTRIELRTATLAPRSVSFATLLEGFRYIWRSKLILGSISLDLFAVFLGGAVALLPVYAREILNIGPYGLGILRSAPSLGAVLMAITVAHFPLRRRAGLIMLCCVFGFGLLTILFGISRSFALSLVALVLLGACDMISVIVRQTLVQLATPDQMRGRVSAVSGIFVGTSNELGGFESGVTAQWFGTVPAVVLGGVGTILVVLLWSWLFPPLRRVDGLVPEPATNRQAVEASSAGD